MISGSLLFVHSAADGHVTRSNCLAERGPYIALSCTLLFPRPYRHLLEGLDLYHFFVKVSNVYYLPMK